MKKNLQESFTELLSQLFHLDEPSLDIGIYRIIRQRRDALRQFIQRDLLNYIYHQLATPSEHDPEVRAVFNHLVRFFNRYFHEGEFIPLHRFGKQQHYIIPYNGEEIYFYWVNRNQYYIKSSPIFYTYRFVFNSMEVQFLITEAETSIGNTKASERRLFFPAVPSWEITDERIQFFFEYRAPLSREKKVDGKKVTQKILNELLLQRFERYLEEKNSNLSHWDRAELIPELSHHLSRFTRANERDYFIHRNLKDFLLQELDFYLKSEVLGLEDITSMKSREWERLLQQARIIHEVATKIIDFLHQLEEYQKRLWEKRKYVLSTEVVISLKTLKERGGDVFWKEVLREVKTNSQQIKEWQQFFGFPEPPESLEEFAYLLKQSPWNTLPLDTSFFQEEFKNRLFSQLTARTPLTELLDGVLIHSENWTALNSILPLFENRIKSIYIDPPFNKDKEADYLYKVGYKDSTWLTMLENRIELARQSLRDDGCIFVRCDYNGTMYVRFLLDSLFGKDNFRNEIIVNRTLAKQSVDTQFTIRTETLYLYARSESFKPFPVERPIPPRWYPLLHFPRKDERPREILGNLYYPPRNRRWALSQEKIDRLIARGKVRINMERTYVDCFGKTVKGMPELLYDTETVGNEWLDIPGYAQRHHFATENAEALLRRVIESSSQPGEWVMDFFLGSGTTVATAHKLQRKWVGIEMGDHFFTVILPRMKKVLWGDPGKFSKEVGWTGGGCFIYHTLEQFEDTLENIDTEALPEQHQSIKNFITSYMLPWTTRRSKSLLPTHVFQDPFNFFITPYRKTKSQTQLVDLVFTTAYWGGIDIGHIEHLIHNERRYTILTGERYGEYILVILRPLSELDYTSDARFIEECIQKYRPTRTYVNGDCGVEGVANLEGLLKSVQFPVNSSQI
ncbi:MAG: site-specific DNA-methyltransferase [Calditrichaeota bacterium]|nr:MAG: site-specific DNA-methyltransferase [Calditrichota bacterium]